MQALVRGMLSLTVLMLVTAAAVYMQPVGNVTHGRSSLAPRKAFSTPNFFDTLQREHGNVTHNRSMLAPRKAFWTPNFFHALQRKHGNKTTKV